MIAVVRNDGDDGDGDVGDGDDDDDGGDDVTYKNERTTCP